MKIHNAQKHGTLIVQTDPNAEAVWNSTGWQGIQDAHLIKGSHDFDPRDMANLSSIQLSMSKLSDEELQTMVKHGLQAQVALKVRREQPVTTEEVYCACLPAQQL